MNFWAIVMPVKNIFEREDCICYLLPKIKLTIGYAAYFTCTGWSVVLSIPYRIVSKAKLNLLDILKFGKNILHQAFCPGK